MSLNRWLRWRLLDLSERVRGWITLSTIASWRHRAAPPDPVWERRSQIATSCPDNAAIPRVAAAGQARGRWITMHNGLQVLRLGYYGRGMAQLLRQNRGVHEPQEERVFAQVLETLPQDATMLELGAYWGFYSMWFLTHARAGRAVLVEPRLANLAVGRRNFARNRLHGTFLRGWIGGRSGVGERGIPILTVDQLCQRYAIPFLHILHADIQGAELEMLQGATESLAAGRVGYLFISTHSTALHRACLEFLQERHFTLLASADTEESYSVDGLIVARSASHSGVEPLTVALRPGPLAEAALPPEGER